MNTVGERYRSDQLQGGSNLQCNGHSRSAPTTPRSKIRKPKMFNPSLPFPSLSSSTPNSATSSPANTRRRLKSKTPPPGYRVTSTQKHEGLRQRHQSVDRLLDDTEPPPVGSQNGQLDLFESLLGDSLPPTNATAALFNSSYAHRHSKSSPTSDRLHL